MEKQLDYILGEKRMMCHCPDYATKSVFLKSVFCKYVSKKANGATSWYTKMFGPPSCVKSLFVDRQERSSLNPLQACMVIVVLARWLRKPLVSFTGLFTSKTKTSSLPVRHTHKHTRRC